MDNEKVLVELEEIKTYAASRALDSLNYAIEVFRRLDDAGVKDIADLDTMLKKIADSCKTSE
ncbi:MAG: hypothetical protein K6F69_05755 [Treponema sp.]|nr:hypothetical protein [Treponema sp.]